MEGEALSLLLSSFLPFVQTSKFSKKTSCSWKLEQNDQNLVVSYSTLSKSISWLSKLFSPLYYIHRDNVCLGKNVPLLRLLEAASRCIEILSYLFHLLGSQNEHLHTYLNIQYKIIGPLCLDYK